MLRLRRTFCKITPNFTFVKMYVVRLAAASARFPPILVCSRSMQVLW